MERTQHEEEHEKEWEMCDDLDEVIPWSEETFLESEESGWRGPFSQKKDDIQQLSSSSCQNNLKPLGFMMTHNNQNHTTQGTENEPNRSQSNHAQLLDFHHQSQTFPNLMCDCSYPICDCPNVSSLIPKFIKRWIVLPCCVDVCSHSQIRFRTKVLS
eukprot:c10816_g1_i1.p1 GENE.c10816_g1_i1~~c10816_g1_i1.p1  ORF type:complete len:157 (-),score=37.84 c10816_g1_i1:113-583(-)